MEASSELNAGETALWIAEHDGSTDVEALISLLSEDEQQRLGSMRSERRRDEHVIARAMTRTVLARCLGLEPGEVHFSVDPEGKPRLDARHSGHWGFSISHTDGMVVLAVSPRGEVGVDVEALSGPRDARALSRRFLHALERHYVESANDDREIQLRFLQVWTLKEAYLKALGTGLSGSGLAAFGFGFEPEEQRIRLYARDEALPASPWDFEILYPSMEHVLALASQDRSRPGRPRSAVSCYRLSVPELEQRPFDLVPGWSSHG